jgi:hypothetical protein
MVEGSTHALKVKALEHHEALHSTVPPGAKEVVFEERYEVDNTGQIVTRPMKITWEQNVKFTFRFFSEVYSMPNPLRTDADWWQALKRCDKVRDYLMHPRTAHDLNIKPEIIRDVMVAERGFGKALEALIDGLEEVRSRTSGGQEAESDL